MSAQKKELPAPDTGIGAALARRYAKTEDEHAGTPAREPADTPTSQPAGKQTRRRASTPTRQQSASKQVREPADKPAREPASKPARRQAGKQTRQQVSTPARQQADTPDDVVWVNFSTYLPEPLRRELRVRCATLDIELREAMAEAVKAWLDTRKA